MKISINGKVADTNKTTAFSLKKSLKNTSEVIILNGFACNEDKVLKENDQLFFIDKNTIPPDDMFEAMITSRHTPFIHEKLKRGRVAIAGLGGLGSNVAVSLARIGVGTLLLVDFDVVEPSNLNRQHYFTYNLGQNKTAALANQIKDINPFVRVGVCNKKVTAQNATDIFKDYNIVCECFDDPSAKAMLVNSLMSEFDNLKIVAASGMAGHDSSNLITTKRKMKNLYICGDEVNEAKEGNGLMAPRVQICAGHQANMVLRLLLNIEDC